MNSKINWKYIDQNPFQYASTSSRKNLEKIKDILDHHYYNGESKISDASYDIILDYMKNKYKIKNTIGAKVTRNKVKLPVILPSMDKVKADTTDLQKWLKKYKGNYLLSDKLDGVSLLVFNDNDKYYAYTRGDSEYGQDISWILKYINIGILPQDHLVRGELIISKKNFNKVKKIHSQYANSRNFVSGYIGRKSIEPEIIQLIDFVAYELIAPESGIASDGLQILKSNGFNVVKNFIADKIDNKLLSNYLLERREECEYEIDGIIITDNNVHERVTESGKNPDYARAFKMVLDDQTAEVSVLEIKWEPSMHGIINPVVKVSPVILDNVKISNVTGYNANFIINNNIGGCIGPGAKVLITRSGGVIPKILSVIEPYKYSKYDCLPKNYKYDWTESNIDIILTEPDESSIVIKKRIEQFFKSIDVDYFKKGIINKVVTEGYDSVSKILNMSKEQFLSIDGIQDKLANKIYNEIKLKYSKSNLANIMAGSCCFGYGLGSKLIENIIYNVSDILEKNSDDKNVYNAINNIKGFNTITTSKFMNNLDKFKQFYHTLPHTNPDQESNITVIGNKFNGMNILFTGFRPDSKYKEYVISNGGIIKDSFTKDVNLLVMKDINTETGQKYQKALKANIPIIQFDML